MLKEIYNDADKSESKGEIDMQDAVLKIKKIGVPPEGFEDVTFPEDEGFPSEDILDLWDEYQAAVESIALPITWEEAEILIKCCPTDHMAGIEWSLLHCIESCTRGIQLEKPEEMERYKRLISECTSDMMREELLRRLSKHSPQSTKESSGNNS